MKLNITQGSSISLSIGAFHPEALRAIHLTLIAGMPPPPSSPFAFLRFLATHFLNLYSTKENEGLRAANDYQERGNAYFQIQKTRPNTIGVALADSPVGLLAWIYDKLVSWTDNYAWTPQEVCEWVSLYWFSRAGPAASVVIYHEASKGDWQARAGLSVPGTKMVRISNPSVTIHNNNCLHKRDFLTSRRRSSVLRAPGTDGSGMLCLKKSTTVAAILRPGKSRNSLPAISASCLGKEGAHEAR